MPHKNKHPLYIAGYRDGLMTSTRRATYAVKIKSSAGSRYFCGKCGKFRQRISRNDYFCRTCGAIIDWKDIRGGWEW